jgi:hypothetical protein
VNSEFRFTHPRFVSCLGLWLVNCQLWSGHLLVAEARHWSDNVDCSWNHWSDLSNGTARSLIQP